MDYLAAGLARAGTDSRDLEGVGRARRDDDGGWSWPGQGRLPARGVDGSGGLEGAGGRESPQSLALVVALGAVAGRVR